MVSKMVGFDSILASLDNGGLDHSSGEGTLSSPYSYHLVKQGFDNWCDTDNYSNEHKIICLPYTELKGSSVAQLVMLLPHRSLVPGSSLAYYLFVISLQVLPVSRFLQCSLLPSQFPTNKWMNTRNWVYFFEDTQVIIMTFLYYICHGSSLSSSYLQMSVTCLACDLFHDVMGVNSRAINTGEFSTD